MTVARFLLLECEPPSVLDGSLLASPSKDCAALFLYFLPKFRVSDNKPLSVFLHSIPLEPYLQLVW